MEERDSREEEEKLSRSEEEKIEKTLRSMTEDIEVPESRGVYLSGCGDCRGIRGILYGQARQTGNRRFSDGRNRKNTAEG